MNKQPNSQVVDYLLTCCNGRAYDIATPSLANRVKELEFEVKVANKRIHSLEVELERILLETRQNEV